MPNIDLGSDPGFVNMTIEGTELRLDAWEVMDKFALFHETNKAKSDDAYGGLLTEFVTSFGFPPISRRMAQLFIEAMMGVVEEIKKKHSAAPASAASSTSTPGA